MRAGTRVRGARSVSMAGPTRFSATRRRPNGWVIAGIVMLHLGLFYVLLRSLAPDFTGPVEREFVSAFTVTVTAPEEPPPPPPEAPDEDEDEGEQGDPGADAVPAPTAAPPPPRVLREDRPAPRVASTGDATRAGAAEAGEGTGRAGSGDGLGSGRGGAGRGGGGDGGGGGAVTRPSVQSGTISSARDFPIPQGGREIRTGTSVTVTFTVGVDGRASNCSVSRPGPDPATNALVCPLVIERIRFNPARNANGEPVPARYGWRQDFRAL